MEETKQKNKLKQYGQLICGFKTQNWATLEEKRAQEEEAKNEAEQCVHMVLRIGSTKKTGKNIHNLEQLSCCKSKPQRLFLRVQVPLKWLQASSALRYDNFSGENHGRSSAL